MSAQETTPANSGASLVGARFKRADLRHEATFEAPLFDLSRHGPSLLQSLHKDVINAGSTIALDNMRLHTGASPSDVRVQVLMYSGNAEIEITATKCTVQFNNMSDVKFIGLAGYWIDKSWEAVERLFPETQASVVTIRPEVILELTEGTGAEELLGRIVECDKQYDWKRFGAVIEHPCMSLELENSKESWNVFLNLARDQSLSASILMSCLAIYGNPYCVDGNDNILSHLQKLMKAFLDQCGLSLEDIDESE